MSKYITTYCPHCDRDTVHEVYYVDGLGGTGAEMIMHSIFTLGFNHLYSEKIYRCLSCGRKI